MPKRKNNPKIEDLSGQILPILRRYGVVYTAVFGSAARGEQTEDSDLDLLMKYKKGTTLLDASGLQLELEKKLGRSVDLVSFKYLHRRIRDRVLKEQIRIL